VSELYRSTNTETQKTYKSTNTETQNLTNIWYKISDLTSDPSLCSDENTGTQALRALRLIRLDIYDLFVCDLQIFISLLSDCLFDIDIAHIYFSPFVSG
jgi:hypothetical protein